ncbi:hypothetical protein [Bacillus alveayuensis]|jgi:hypothetical protein|uniref:hypothetical protein n=1 Tax=Aeribacillus alveayuensis TaxID=279215 RepID=UPI0005CCA4D0|nr:hypothetical protein [Bacillus alveayuensis]
MRISILFVVLSMFFVAPFTTLANGNQDIIGAINKEIKKNFTDYKDHSVRIIDSLTTSAEVTEEEVKETRNIEVIFAHAKKVEVRDSIFYLDFKQIYYYDLDNKTIIDSGLIEKNEQIEKFINKYKKQTGKQINTLSLTIFMAVLLLSVIVFPILIVVFHNNSRSSSYKLHLEQASSGMFRS